MKKSKDVTKYDPDWQIVRVSVKGPSTSLDDKLRIANEYFARNKTYDAWERVANWLEGLQMGYKAAGDTAAIERIAAELSRYNGIVPSTKEPQLSDDDVIARLKRYSPQQRLQLWRDLFDRNKKWLAKGYNHGEHNHFMDLMYQVFTAQKENIPSSVSKEKLDALRKSSATLQNTHKFFF
jgi:hypothetical protein